jgi:CRISPR-associated protein Csx3
MLQSSANLFPAILVAGPPHSGKSVLSFLLSGELNQISIAHYLLRADPSGEGNWFHLGDAAVVRPLRQAKKGHYSPEFVAQVTHIIQNRLLPLLVDVGGKPQGTQFDILRACTHAILLYRTENERTIWRNYLAEMNLSLVAELHSQLHARESIAATHPHLQGIISGLDRHNYHKGMTFGALLDRVAGICRYDEAHLARIHRSTAPQPFLSERRLLATSRGNKGLTPVRWAPDDLKNLTRILPKGEPWAVYGRGPVWLAAFLSLQAAPAPIVLFDARYGWVNLPKIRFQEGSPPDIAIRKKPWDEMDALWMDLQLSETEIAPGGITIPRPEEEYRGLVLSGALPRWLFAGLARTLAPKCQWLAIDDPAMKRVIVVHSKRALWQIGDSLPRL